MSKILDHGAYLVGWISPLEVEQIAAIKMLDERHKALPQLPADHNVYSLGSINGHNVVIAGLHQPGNCSAATVAAQMRMTFPNLRYGLLVGIGGGVPVMTDNGMIRLGHVVVSKPTGVHSGTVQYDHGKAKDGIFERTGTLAPPPAVLLNAAQNLVVYKALADTDPLEEHIKRIDTSRKALRRFQFPGATKDYLSLSHSNQLQPGASHEGGSLGIPQRGDPLIDEDGGPDIVIHRGTIASGELVIEDAILRNQLSQQLDILCFEMEAAGALADFPCIVIRGVADYCDSHKNNDWHGYAAAVAAAYARQLFFHMPIEKKIEKQIEEDRLLEQADDYIRHICYNAECLKIERLSGERLPMQQCYINLSIVEQGGRDHDQAEMASLHASSFSLLALLGIEKPTATQLQHIFDDRMISRTESVQTRRVFIRGRAGIGKTTLCKKAVYEFINSGTWGDLFERLLWIPLRILRSQTGRYDLSDLFRDEFFSQHSKCDELAAALRAACDKPNGGNTLFVLDGLDEIWHDLSQGTGMFRFVVNLLNQPNVIVASRSSVTPPAGIKSFDLELETIGFEPEQVAAYVAQVEPENASTIRSFLDNHHIIRDLVRVPIQLDALCFAWKDVSEEEPETMTDLYRAIERGLWRKDIMRLGKKIDRRPVNEQDSLHANEVEGLIQDEAILLEALAFTGLYNNVIVFDSKFRTAISTHFAQPGKPIDMTLRKLSYLRTSDLLAKEQNRAYHFLHLTFQEYFAARYFVRMWRSGQKLKCLHPNSGACSDINVDKIRLRSGHKREENLSPEMFFQQHKYSLRYDIVWRFVAGLLSSGGTDGEHETKTFFNSLQEEPLDLLGSAHHRLMMHCLHEVPLSLTSSPLLLLRQELESKLVEWMAFQSRMVEKQYYTYDCPITLASEFEFPEKALVTILRGGKGARNIALQSMPRQRAIQPSGRGILPQIMDCVVVWLSDGTPKDLLATRLVLRMLENTDEPLPDVCITVVAECLKYHDGKIRECAREIIRKRPDLENSLTDALGVYHAATKRLEAQEINWKPRESDPFYEPPKDYQKLDIGRAASQDDQSSRPSSSINSAATHTHDRDSLNRQAEMKALQGCPILSAGMLSRVMARLEDQDLGVRRAAIEVLRVDTRLLHEEHALRKIIARLRDQDKFVRWAAAEVLSRHRHLPGSITDELLALLEDQQTLLRRAALGVLVSQSTLSDVVFSSVATCAEDQDSHIRLTATKTLCRQSGVPEEMVNGTAIFIARRESFVGRVVLEMLCKRIRLPEGLCAKLLSIPINENRLLVGLLEYHDFHRSFLTGPHVKDLVQRLLRHSLDNHLAWIAHDGISRIEQQSTVYSVKLDDWLAFQISIGQVLKDLAMPNIPRQCLIPHQTSSLDMDKDAYDRVRTEDIDASATHAGSSIDTRRTSRN